MDRTATPVFFPFSTGFSGHALIHSKPLGTCKHRTGLFAIRVAMQQKLNMSNPFFDHPILNSPYDYPRRHWELDAQGQPTQKVLEIDIRTPYKMTNADS